MRPSSLLSRMRATRTDMFRSLAIRNYRLFFAGHAVSVTGTWMQRVAQDWLIYTITGSGVALGLASALQFGPMLLFGIWGGSVVDKKDRRLLLIGTQSLQAILALILGIIIVIGAVQLWMVYMFAGILGFVTVIDSPSRQAFVSDLVGPDDYVNAQSLNSTVHNVGRLVGPAIAGIIIAKSGVAPAFLINAVSFAAVLIGLFRMDRSEMIVRPARLAGGRPSRAVDGALYVWRHRQLRSCVLIIGVLGLFGQNFRVVLPLFASETFGGGAQQYGYLTSALGLGAVGGALFMASRRTVSPRTMLLSTVLFGVTNIGAAISPSIVWAYAALIMMGIANISVNTLGRTLLMIHSDVSMHGRILALHGLVFIGTTPIGGPLLGWFCELGGARLGFVVAATSALAVSAVAAPALLSLGQYRVEPSEA